MSTKSDQIPLDAAAATEVATTVRPGSRSILDAQTLLRRAPRRHSQLAFVLAVTWVGLLLFVALFAGVLPLRRFDVIVADLPPRLAPRLSWTEPLGTDVLGRSVTSRLIYGARQSLLVGLFSTAAAMTVGLVIGMTAGYFRGRVDQVIIVFLDAILSIPALVLLLAVASIGKRDVTTVIVGLGLVGIPTFARLARANTLALVDREYVMAARAMGAGHLRILLREILPSVIFPISSFAFLFMAIAVVAEGSLSFLGLGIPPPTPSWGGMVNDARPYLDTKPFLVFVPAACLVITVVSFTLIGDRARRHFDIQQSALP